MSFRRDVLDAEDDIYAYLSLVRWAKRFIATDGYRKLVALNVASLNLLTILYTHPGYDVEADFPDVAHLNLESFTSS